MNLRVTSWMDPFFFYSYKEIEMNFMKFLGFVLALNLLVFSLFAQDKPKAKLIDEFGKINEGELLARLDSFILTLQN